MVLMMRIGFRECHIQEDGYKTKGGKMLVLKLITVVMGILVSVLFSTGSIAGSHYGKGEESEEDKRLRNLKKEQNTRLRVCEEKERIRNKSVAELESDIKNLENQLQIYKERIVRIKEEEKKSKESKVKTIKDEIRELNEELKDLEEEK
jgi:chromosome segregation ATPase